MSEKQFENFLVDRLLGWCGLNLNKGYRYQFQSPDSENSKKLYDALCTEKSGTIIIKDVAIPFVSIEKVNLLIVLHNEEEFSGFSENFISHIRDVVAAQQGEVKDCSLLVIHNSLLDTLINSAENIAQIGSVWHPNEIMEALKTLIDPADPSEKVSRCLLNHRFEQITEDDATMFGFEELYKAMVDDGDLRFDEIGLLNDPALQNWDGPEGQINSRLEKNKQLYERLNYVTHNFPTNLEEKLGEMDIGPAFVKKYFLSDEADTWKRTLEFSAFEQEQHKNRENFLELERETVQEGTLFTRNRTETKAGKRDKHLICLLDEYKSEFEIELSFIGGKLDKKQCSIRDASEQNILISTPDNTGGKRSRISITGKFSGKAVFFSMRVKRDKTTENHNFRIAVFRKGEFLEESFKYNYLINPKKQMITLQTEENSLQISTLNRKFVLERSGQVIDNSEFGLVDYEMLSTESDEVEFVVKGQSTQLVFSIESAVASDVLYLPFSLDQDKFSKLYKDDFNAVLNNAKTKVQIENQEVAPKGKRLTLLQWERELLEEQCLYLDNYPDNNLKISCFDVAYPSLSKAYQEYFNYLNETGTLPSLAGWGGKYRELVSNVVNEYNNAIHDIEYDVLLSKSQKKLINIGFATFRGEEYFTPYHPLVLAFYLHLIKTINKDSTNSFSSLPRITLNRLNAQGLIPFMYDQLSEFSYTHAEPDNAMWLKLVPQQDTSYDYVKKLVKEKVSEFHDAFQSLFESGARSKIIINSVNNGMNSELFVGLIDFIKLHKEKVCKIHVNLYDDEIAYCEFDKFADTHSYDKLKESYGLDKGATKDIADTVIDMVRTRLTYSKFKNQKLDDGAFKAQEYAHLTFFKNNNKVQPTDVNVNEELSGVVATGLLTGEASTSKEDSYFTAFGLKNINCQGIPHLQIAERLNGLIKPARKSNEQHSRSKSMALAVSDKFKKLLACSYQSSIWTTIIDPKVTLDFFDNEQNVVLIHYSDNYTNSVNYDAITVTEESELYKKVLEQDQGGIIEEFNAFNGEWLLKMITANENDRKEKKGIIGAYKFVNCLLHKSEITWVPLSVAEMIRVAGNIGLKMSDSDFSRNVMGYKSGLISDDVLFVGFKDNGIVLMPLEVKTGRKQTHSKGVAQAKELKRYLTEDILGADSFSSHLYRGLFIRQILMQIDKYKLYHLYEDNYFSPILDNREFWLQGDYKIKIIKDYPDGFLVSHVENDTFFEPSFDLVDDILKIQLPISYLNKFIRTPLRVLFAETQPEKLCHVDAQFILSGNEELQDIEMSLTSIGLLEEEVVVADKNVNIQECSDSNIQMNNKIVPAQITSEHSDRNEVTSGINTLEANSEVASGPEVFNYDLYKITSNMLERLSVHEAAAVVREAYIKAAGESRKYNELIQKAVELRKTSLDEKVAPVEKQESTVKLLERVPKAVKQKILCEAEEAFENDQELIDNFVGSEVKAYFELQELKENYPSPNIMEALEGFIERQFVTEFNWQLKETKQQLLCVSEIESISTNYGLKSVKDLIQIAREEFPGDFKNQLALIKETTDLNKQELEEEQIQLVAQDKIGKAKPESLSTEEWYGIIENVESLFPDDYISQLDWIEKHLEAMGKVFELMAQFNSKSAVLELIDDVRGSYPGDYVSQLEVIESKIATALNSELPVNPDLGITPNVNIETLKVLIGNNIQNDEDVFWEPTNTAKFMNTNSGIIGTMGTGKTQCTKSVITQLYRNQNNNVDSKPIGVLIFDYKSDYVDDKFLSATNAKKFKLYKLPYNPLSLFGDTPMLPIHTAAGFSETMAKAYSLGKKQQLKLENIILEAYDLAGIKSEDPSTWKRPAPTIENIWDLFLVQEKVEEDSLYAALSKLARFKIFETTPEKMMSLYELVDGVTVIELAGYPTEVQNLIVALTLDLFYSQMQKQGKPEVQGDFRQVSKLILVDEADNFMSQNFSSLRRILKEGREYGVGVILSTQDITHFKTNENDYSAYILSWIVHRVSQIKNQDIKSIFNKDDKADQEQLMKSIRGLDKHYSLYVNGDKKITKIKDKAFWELIIKDES